MIRLAAQEIAAVVGGTFHPGSVAAPAAAGSPRARAAEDGPTVTAPAVVDSRRVEPGGLFVAMRGRRHDGHEFAAQAVAAGAALILGERPTRFPTIVVEDVALALGLLARAVLDRLSPLVIGLTGSSGKTTTKDLLAQILERRGPTIANEGSYNNEIGLPLTVLRADRTTRFLILEMGAARPGDLRYLAQIAPPQFGMVLNVGHAHLATMGGLEATASTKAELVEGLPPATRGGFAILNAADPRVAAMATRTRARVVSFDDRPLPCSAAAEVRAEHVHLDGAGRARFTLVTPAGRTRLELAIIGVHQVANALAAAAMASVLEVPTDDIGLALSAARRRSAERLAVTERVDGVTVVNDAFNANPESMAAGLQAVQAMANGRRTIAVLGEMLGQSVYSGERHAEIGRLAAELGFGALVTVGNARPAAAAARAADPRMTVAAVADRHAALPVLDSLVRPGDIVLIKASHEVRLSELAAALESCCS